MKNNKQSFTTLREAFNTAALAGVVYVPYSYSIGAQLGTDAIAGQMATIGAIFMILRLRWLREVPLLAGRALFLPLVARGRQNDPELQAMVDEMLAQTGSGKKVRVMTYERGITNNAMAYGNDILVGRKVRATMDRDQVKFILAHELAHIESQDMSERYLFIVPYIDALVGVILAAGAFLRSHDANPLPLAAAAGYYVLAKGVRAYHSRFGEYRADANGLRLTGRNSWAAVGALAQLYANAGKSVDKQPTLWDTWDSTHPIGRDRTHALIAAAARPA